MEEKNTTWLPNFSKEMVTGIRGFNICAYLMALEGWRRGLTLRWYYPTSNVTNMKMVGFNPIGKLFSLRSEDKTHYFYRSRGDKVTNEAVDIGTNKEVTKGYLARTGIPVPEGKRFGSDASDADIIEYASSIGFPLVIKPTHGSLGKGVVTNIQDEQSLRKAVNEVRSDLGYDDVILERFITGEDFRVYVVGDQVVGVIKRVPAHVTGDGVNTIEQLIEMKNEERMKNPLLSSRLINIDQRVIDYISDKGHTPQSIPNKDEIVYLKGISNISSGGDSIDATDDFSSDIKNIAINAVKAIPGLYQAGVDIIFDHHRAKVIEINPTADISLHLFPVEGAPRNIPAAIIDYYFPETKGLSHENAKIYFDYKKIFDMLMSKSVNEMEVVDAPVGELYAKRYVISGKVQGVGFRWWIRKKALQKGLHGYTRNLRNGKVVVVVAGADKDEVDDFKLICWNGPTAAEVTDVQEYLWEKQIKAGFEIRKKNKIRKK